MGRDSHQLRCLPPRGIQIDGSAAAATPLENVIRRTVATIVLGVFDPDTEVGTFGIRFTAHNPSPRLRWSISVAWDMQNGYGFTPSPNPDRTLPTWAMRAVRRNPLGGFTADLNQIFAAPRLLPDAYELDSAVKDVVGVVNLTVGDMAAGLAAQVIIEARWEPNGVVDDDVRRLIRSADLQVIDPATFVNATIA